MIRKASWSAAIIGFIAILISVRRRSGGHVLYQHVQGKNNTILFMTTEHPGLYNVHLSTVYSLIENHPQIKIHYASFPKIASRVEQISSLAASRQSSAKNVTFHSFTGRDFKRSLLSALPQDKNGTDVMIHGHGLAGLRALANATPLYIAPWEADELWSLYKQSVDMIDTIDPSLVVLDALFAPAIDAVRNKNRLHAIIMPNEIKDGMPNAQPIWTRLWKYPAMGSGYPYPVPWKLIPANMYMRFKVIASLVTSPGIKVKKAFLKEKGVENPIDFRGFYRADMPWITQALPGVHVPMVIPRNVSLTGPINLASTEKETDAGKKLIQWTQKPTVIINLGGIFEFSEATARLMLNALLEVMKETDVQFLWKMKMADHAPFNDKFLRSAAKKSAGRLQIESWLEIEPPTLLQQGNIVAYVHHGGAGNFHDAIGGGVPQVVLPQWSDLYDFAQLAENVGVGIWGCRETSPEWTSGCVKSAILKVVKDSENSGPVSKKAKEVGERVKKERGRDIAAREIARLASVGY